MKNNTATKTEYQKLSEKLNDINFARKYFEQKEVEAKELVAQILMVTSGAGVVTGNDREWGHRIFYQLFEIFQINHENFNRSDLAESLQFHLFIYSREHDAAFREWAKDWNIKSELPLDLSEMSAESLNTDDTQTNKHFADCISEILKNPSAPSTLQNALRDGLNDIFNSEIHDQTELIDFQDSPEYIEKLLNLAVNQ